MKNRIVINIAAFVLTAVISVAISIVSALIAEGFTEKLNTISVEGTDGAQIAAYSIEELPGLNEVRYVNYTADEFLSPRSEISGEVIDLNQHPYFEGKGTLQFVFKGLDSSDNDFNDKSQALAPYLRGDNAWHFTLYLPAMTGAVNIYVGTKYVCSAGQISNYNFTDYSDYGGYTKEHISKTEPFYIDLSFNTYSSAENEGITAEATTVTIHFEAAEGKNAHFTALPVAGDGEKVVFAVSTDRTALIIASVVASLITAVFLFAAILKRTLKFLPPTIAVAGILGFTFFTQIMYASCSFAYTARVLTGAFAALIPFSAICGMREKIKKFPVWIPFAAFAAANCVIAALAPIFATAIFGILSTVFNSITALMTIALAGLKALNAKSKCELIIPVFSAAFVITHTFSRERTFILVTPQIWMCAAILLVTMVLGVALFAHIERRNRFLTTNLKGEVERQTTELRNMIDDRDKLLRYLSHDLKKPAVRAKIALNHLRTMENDKEKLKLIDVAECKIKSIDTGLADLQRYAKQNYASELTTEVNAGEILQYVYASLKPDCDAQGVHLYVTDCDINAFAKRNMLVSVMTNLIFNALEHAQCQNIKIYAESTLKYCRIFITDDGKGLTDKEEAFRPYSTEADGGENLGLGLYLCRQLMQAMGGDLVYERQNKKTMFIASVPLASEKDI